MLIDWFTVAAQALNFLILVWLMKRFLYQPILHAIDEREKRIAAELADADAKKAEAQKERDEFQHKNEEFDQQRAALLTKATDEAKAERQRLLDEARKAVAAGRGADAIQTLDRYQRDYPRGRLGHEAAFVRMQALMSTGNRAAAVQMAEQFLRANPNSPLAPRVRELATGNMNQE